MLLSGWFRLNLIKGMYTFNLRCTEAMFQRQPRLVLMLAVGAGSSLKVTQVILVLKIWKDHGKQLRLGNVRGRESPLVKVQP